MDNELVARGVEKAVSVAGKSASKNLPGWLGRHKSTLLTLGIIGSEAGAIYFAMKDGRFILDTLHDAKLALQDADDKEERKMIYKTTGKELAIPVGRIMAFYAGSVTCAVVMKKDCDAKDKKIAELTTALGLASNAIAQYKLWQDQAEKELGEDKVKEINTKVADKVLPAEERKALPVDADQVSGNHMYHYYDVWGSRDFWSERSPAEVENFLRDSSYDMCDGNMDDDQFTMNDLYRFMRHGLEIGGGNSWGWTADMGRGQRTSDIINVVFSPTEARDHETLMWQMDACPSPLFPKKSYDRY